MKASRYQALVRAALALTCSLILVGCPCLRPGTVIFPDAALESAVRSQLRLPFGCLTQFDLLRLTELEATGLNIRNLEGLQHCRNLITLNLSNNNIVSLWPLASLTNLARLDLTHNQITDIEPLTGLFFLNMLLLDGNPPIRDLSPLEVNALSGGFPEGGVVTIDEITALDVDGDPLPGFLRALFALNARGVDVIVIVP